MPTDVVTEMEHASMRSSTPWSLPLRPQALKIRIRRLRGQLALLLGDVVLVLLAFTLAYWLRYEFVWPAPLQRVVREVAVQNYVPLEAFQPLAALLTVTVIALFAMKGLYRLPRSAGVLDHASIIAGGTTTAVAIMIVLVFIWTSTQFYSRLIFGFAWASIVALLVIWRFVFIGIRRYLWTRGVGRERMLVVGATGLGRQVMEGIVAQPDMGYALAGYLDDRPAPPSERPDGHFRHLGSVEDLPAVLGRHDVEQVILALPFWEHNRLPGLVAQCRDADVEFRLAPDLYELSFDRVDVGEVGGVPLIGLKEVSLKGLNLVIKRAMDIALILLVSPALLVLGAIIGVAIRMDSPGPVIFEQGRVGKGGRRFTAYKFRTMVEDAEERKAELAALNEADGPIFKIRNDPRMTKVGRLLRRTSLDELPQFWNILRGDMSIVGPRPPTPDEVERYEHWHRRRLEVTPGLTGLWQVLGRSDTSFDEMVRLDIYYAENWSPGMDLRIMLQTIPAVLSGKGAY